MKFLETGKIDSGITNGIAIPRSPTISAEVPKTKIKTKSPDQFGSDSDLTLRSPLSQKDPMEQDEGNLLFWILVGIFALGLLRG